MGPTLKLQRRLESKICLFSEKELMGLTESEKKSVKAREATLEQDLESALKQSRVDSLEMFLSCIRLLILSATVVITISPVLIFTLISMLKIKLTIHTETLRNGQPWPLWGLPTLANLAATELLLNTAHRFGISNLFKFHILQPIQILELEVLLIFDRLNDDDYSRELFDLK